MIVGYRLQKQRLERGYTQAGLAQAIKISRPFLAQLESGAKPTTTTDVLGRLAQTLDCRAGYLIGLEEAARDEE